MALRNLKKYRLYSAINLIGLVLSVTSCLLLLMYVEHELGYDQFHKKKNEIYRIVSFAELPDNQINIATTPAPLGPALVKDFPAVVNYVRITEPGRLLVEAGDKKFYEEEFLMADKAFFELFDFPMNGNIELALKEPNSLVISESLAEKYFGHEPAIGQLVTIDNEEAPFQITGVMKDLPQNTHFKASGLISYSTLDEDQVSFWGNFNNYTYIHLPGVTKDQFESNLVKICERYMAKDFSQFDAKVSFSMQALTDIHLRSTLEAELKPPGDISFIYIFTAIATLMIVIAGINYMNLATARSIGRAKEVGVRKVLGSVRSQLIKQFLLESTVMVVISVVIGLSLLTFLFPWFNELSGKDLNSNMIFEPINILSILLIIVVVGIGGGMYPAFYLSRFNPVDVLNGRKVNGTGYASLRKILVIVQFAISVILIICTLIIFDQLTYLQQKDLGFDKDHLIKIEINNPAAHDKLNVLATVIRQHPKVTGVTTGSATPGGENLNAQLFSLEKENGDSLELITQSFNADIDYIPTLGIEIREGRNFKSKSLDSAKSVLVNQALVEKMNWTQPIGKKIGQIYNRDLEMRIVKVVGVIRDFHLRSLNDLIEPMIISFRERNDYLLVRVNPVGLSSSINQLEKDWQKIMPQQPFEYRFVDQDFQAQYKTHQSRGQIMAAFSIFSIIIACLGLFGLASFASEQRTKEFSIRKVVGAGAMDIVFLMSKEFLILIAISTLISFPISYYFSISWLQNFPYHIEISLNSFAFAALLTFVFTFATISFHTIKTIQSNPARTLKME